MLQVLQKFQFSVCSLGQNRGAKGLHDLLNRNILASQVVLCGALQSCQYRPSILVEELSLPDQAKRAHADRLEIRVPARNQFLLSQTWCGVHPAAAWPRIP